MSTLIMHNIDNSILQALKERAARHERSVEAEHRVLLEELLLKPRRPSLAEVLAAIPRHKDAGRMNAQGLCRRRLLAVAG